MPLAPTPPKPMCGVAKWMMVSLMQPPPNEQVCVIYRTVFLSSENRYSASGCGWLLMAVSASSSESYVKMGRIARYSQVLW